MCFILQVSRLCKRLTAIYSAWNDALHCWVRERGQVSVELWGRDCMSKDMFHSNGRVSESSWNDSLVNSCSSINQIAPARLFEERTKKDCLHISAPPGVLILETFVEEKMNSTISPPIYRGKRHITLLMKTDPCTISPSKRMMKSNESKCVTVVGQTVTC